MVAKKILVVDNNDLCLKFMDRELSKHGHEVRTASDALIALDILESYLPDVMFVDLVMSNISGEKLCRIIRGMPEFDDVFIVILSAIAAEEGVNLDNYGADACIAKGPFSKMAENIMVAVEKSNLDRKREIEESIIGLDGVDRQVYARQMTKELLYRNRHLEIMLESIAEGILEVYSGKVVYANSTALSILGVSQEKILGSNFIDIFDDSLQPQIKPLVDSDSDKPFEIGYN